MKLLVINGPNINMLGVREPQIYGKDTYKSLCKKIKAHAKMRGIKVRLFQSNSEGALVSCIQSAYKKFDSIIINPAAYTHTSVALLDALKAVGIPTVEVHISDISSREDFRGISYVRQFCIKTISGQGINGYLQAIDYLIENSGDTL